jgi:hypothetical protein
MSLRFWLWLTSFSRSGFDLNSQTGLVMSRLVALGGAVVSVIIVFGLFRSWSVGLVEGATFTIWALLSAFCALIAGLGLGLLFGLPTVRRIEVTGNAAVGASSPDVSTGYVESTSLEQIADFLVKSIVALSLVNFDNWLERFNALAANLSATMMSRPIGCLKILTEGRTIVRCYVPDGVPGGFIVASYSILGAILGYLWMRRHFIKEMVTARTEAERTISDEQSRLQSAKAAGLVGSGSSRSNNSERQSGVATQIAETAEKAVRGRAVAPAGQIKDMVDTPKDADDPWKGAFGKSATADGCALSATVVPLASDSSNFQVDLSVTALDPLRRAALKGHTALFYLHPTFGDKPRPVTIDDQGRATLQIFSYGGFTVGVLIDDGTRLELDLAELPQVPELFRQR